MELVQFMSVWGAMFLLWQMIGSCVSLIIGRKRMGF